MKHFHKISEPKRKSQLSQDDCTRRDSRKVVSSSAKLLEEDLFNVGSAIKEVEKGISPCDICEKCFMKNAIFKSCDGDVHEQDWVEVSPQFAAAKGTQRNELSKIEGRCVLHLAEQFNNTVYTHEEKKPPNKLSAVDQVVIFSGKEPDALLNLDIKYGNSIMDICKLKVPTDKKN